MGFLKLDIDYSQRVYGLDILRSAAILVVVFSHCGFLLDKFGNGFPWIQLYDGVELFFVLSGFLIGGILIKLFETEQLNSLSGIFHFLKRRWFRTLPNYYLILLVNIAFAYWGITNTNLNDFSWKFFIFLQNFSGRFYMFFFESWSLSIEEWFYLSFPFLLWLLNYLFKKQYRKKWIFFSLIMLLILGTTALRYQKAASVHPDEYSVHFSIAKMVLFRLDTIAFGVLAAFVRYYYPHWWTKAPGLLAIIGFLLFYPVRYFHLPYDSMFSKVFYLSLVGFGMALLLPYFSSIKTGKGGFYRFFTHTSLISYSAYLINSGIIGNLIIARFMPSTAAGAVLWYIIYWILVYLFSTLLFKYFEKPIMDLRDKKLI